MGTGRDQAMADNAIRLVNPRMSGGTFLRAKMCIAKVAACVM